MQLDYNKEKFTKVRVCGIECKFSNMRIDRSTVPSGLYQYEAADDDESQGDPTRIMKGIMVNICRKKGLLKELYILLLKFLLMTGFMDVDIVKILIIREAIL